MNICASCHFEQYEQYIQTGMGRSLKSALYKNSSSDFSHILFDSVNSLNYRPFWYNDSLYLNEYQIDGLDTTHFIKYHIDYIVGSGHHTNSHLYINNGYLYQAPFTYYTQDSILDFPPGFEDDQNSRFSRKMGLECIACHTAYPGFVKGSENKFNFIPEGIDCERCHGPGNLHVEKIKDGELTDTSKHIDYSIVNPAHLSIELQNDLCARCHLQGNAVLHKNKSFFDFRPGMRLNEIMDVYLPRYSNSDNEFIMASHVDRMKLSQCYIESGEKLSCVSCHDPHKTVKNTQAETFNNKCNSCHNLNSCQNDFSHSPISHNECVSCHMRKSETIDIPHVKITDHKIGIYSDTINKPNPANDSQFEGLVCINNKNPNTSSIIQAYLQQYERFENKSYYLDSVSNMISQVNVQEKQGFYIQIYYLFLKEEYDSIINHVNAISIDSLLNNVLTKQSYNNTDAWTAYRIGESMTKRNNNTDAFLFYQKAVMLAPFNLEFRNKYAVNLFEQKKIQFAIDEFNFIINEDSNFTSAYSNLGYVYSYLGDYSTALSYYNYALNLNPNHEPTLVNKAQLLLIQNNLEDAYIYIDKVLKLNPENQDALSLKKSHEI
tara:strand:- start:14567 stop:16378 length:1812 start_codon:yes stop_codon:yes gene_type:complete